MERDSKSQVTPIITCIGVQWCVYAIRRTTRGAFGGSKTTASQLRPMHCESVSLQKRNWHYNCTYTTPKNSASQSRFLNATPTLSAYLKESRLRSVEKYSLWTHSAMAERASRKSSSAKANGEVSSPSVSTLFCT